MIFMSYKNMLRSVSASYFFVKRSTAHFVQTLYLKDRYIRKKDGSLRFRCKATFASLSLLALLSVVPQATAIQLPLEFSSQMFASADVQDQAEETSTHGEILLSSADFGETDASVTPVEEKPKLEPQTIALDITSGDTLAGVLQKAGVAPAMAYKVVKSTSEHYDPRLIRPGQEIEVKMDPKDGELQFASMSLVSDPIRTVVVERDGDDSVVASLDEKEITSQFFAKRAQINSSLYGSAASKGVPDPIIAKSIKILSWSLDLQREIKRGDTFEILYDASMTDDGYYVRSGEPYYVKLKQAGSEVAYYRHEYEDGRISYFDKDGKGAKKGLLSTPIDGARMSSGFGMRRHPVLGYSKMHKGADFAAPTGTPIYAAGDGVVERANRFSSYGNYIRIRHNNEIKTAYAHLNGFAKGIKAGRRVSQGDVIGYVGTTGRSTGPHLHYEVIVAGKHTNPRSVKVPTSEALEGKELARFKANVAQFEKKYENLLDGQEFAGIVGSSAAKNAL